MSRNEKLDCLKKLQVILQKKFILEDKIKSIPANLKAEEIELDELVRFQCVRKAL